MLLETMSDEDDYMSDKFLTGAADIRPSLVHSPAKKRQIHVELKQKEHIKKQKESKSNSAAANNEKLQMALSKPLEAENRGFKLLAKMGYKPGQPLGKPSTESSSTSTTTHERQRLLEPIGITLKTDRQGLGREAALLKERRQQVREERMRSATSEGTSIEEFRRRATQKHEEKFTLNALRKCRVTCENLDLGSQIQQPEMPWFWPEKSKETDDAEENEDKFESEEDGEMEEEFTNSEKLELLTNYVRTSYYFCYWCGVRYNDEQDLMDNCPGLTKDDH